MYAASSVCFGITPSAKSFWARVIIRLCFFHDRLCAVDLRLERENFLRTAAGIRQVQLRFGLGERCRGLIALRLKQRFVQYRL